MNNLTNQAPYRRLQGSEHTTNTAIGAIGSHGILEEIIGPNTEEINLTSERTSHYSRRGSFDHDTELCSLGDRLPAPDKFLPHRGIDSTQAADFFERCNHGKQDVQINSRFSARTQERAKLLAQKLLMHEVNTHSTQTEGRIGFL